MLNPRWWLKHTSCSLLLLLFLILILRLGWGWDVHRELHRAQADVKSRGQFASVSDVTYERVPDAENVWKLQLRAAGALAPGVDSPRESNLEYPDCLPFPPAWHQLADASEKANVTAFKLARQSRQLHRAQFRDHLQPLQFSTDHLSHARTLTNTLSDGAIYSHLHGDDAEAMERLLDVLHIARTCRLDDFVVSQLVAIGVENCACSSAQLIAPGLHFDAATRPKVQQLINQLSDESGLQTAVIRSHLMERILMTDLEAQVSASNWLIQPLADQELLRAFHQIDIAIEATRCKSYSEAEAVLNRVPEDVRTTPAILWFRQARGPGWVQFPRYSRWFPDSMKFEAYIIRHFRRVAERRATAISFACALYRQDHQRYPQKLTDLVPDYLPSIPTDPFQSDGRPFGYTIAKGAAGQPDRPVIYYDPGGPDLALAPEPIYAFYTNPRPNRRQPSVRQYRDISRFTAPWLAKPVDNNPDKTNSPG